LRYRHESIIERPTVESGEPLKAELSAFVEAVRTGEQPPITGEDGLDVLASAQLVSEQATPQQDRSRGQHAHEQ
jgi:predicted dehydrogenase